MMSLASINLPSPAYVIDERLLKQNLDRLDDIQSRTGVKIILALKAFSTPCVFPLISSVLSGTTASSYFEARLGHEEFSKEVHVYAPAYRPDRFRSICELATSISFNSLSQYDHFKETLCNEYPLVKSFIRINPEHSEVDYPIYDPCAPFSRLGVTRLEWDKAGIADFPFDGLHFHTLCGKNVDALERTLAVIEDKFSDLLHLAKFVNIGGGHGLTYANYDVDRLCDVLNDFQRKYTVKVLMEPGEGVVYKTGFLLATVLDIIENEMPIAILDTSASTHMPDILEMPYRPEIEGAGEADEKSYTYRLGGLTCLSGDVLGDYSFDMPLKIGQRLVFTDMSHYTMVKNTMFNGLNLPAIVRIDLDGKVHIEREFDYPDFVSRLS